MPKLCIAVTVVLALVKGQIPVLPPQWEDGLVNRKKPAPEANAAPKPVVIRIPPTALLAVGFFTVALLSIVMALPVWGTALLIVPLIAGVAVFRYRTIADRDTVTARTLFGSRTVPWGDVDGLQFDKRSWALARLKDGSAVRLPAVTFTTLPQLTEASGGRVPNPYD